ncbi:carbohydrate ABC transporter permease [Paenibacillus sp. YN15]|uniref:carbohydrate ABC transporter permease n=1 Tax=Paenibacillus sp. YN15 TaxID=1742774 RepID=UPI000DCD5888|nr:carbohydrate ABC transporter permease [Paenibacillus sp. YN15]RAV04525.1 carbohydrate ABC transporter permease [Paenibacillus sp. YN15]
MNGIKLSRSDRIFEWINYTILTAVLLAVLYPLYFVVIASFSNPTYVNNGSMVFWPKGWMTLGYEKVFQYADVWIGFRNTIFYTVFGTVLNVAVTMGIAYTMSRRSFLGKKALMIFVLIPMFFGGGLIPTFLVVKGLGLYNTWLAMIILGTVNVFNVIIARTFIQSSIPEELYEAAQMDGCNHFTYFFKIILPLSSSIIAVLLLYYGVGHWNDFFTPLIYLNDKNLFSLQLVLRGILIQSTIQTDLLDAEDAARKQMMVEQIQYALIIVTSLPILAVYPFLQKYFVKGVMIGSVKA